MHLVVLTWDLKDNLLTGQLAVDGLEGLQLVVNVVSVLGVQQDLLDLVTTNQVSNSLTDNLSWEDQVLQDLVVDSSQSSRSWSLLSLSRGTTWLWQDSSLSEEDNVTVWELLLELTGQLDLDLVESTERWDWDEDNNGLLVTGDVNLSDGLELKSSQVSLKLWRAGLQVSESLSNLQLQFGWLLVQDLSSSGRHC